MKETLILLGILLLCSYNFGQQLPDIISEDPSSAYVYYENQGQIVDDFGKAVNEVIYYTTKSTPQILLGYNKIMFSSTYKDTVDSARLRIDMSFVCSPGEDEDSCTPTLITEEQTNDYLNFYYSHCPN